MKTNTPLSIIILSGSHKPFPQLAGFSDLPVYATSETNTGEAAMFIRHLRNGDGEIIEIQDIHTPWVLLLEEDEILLPKDQQKLLDYCRKNEGEAAELIVERYMPHDETGKYAWVTTRESYTCPSKAMKRYFTSELRLITSFSLKNMRIPRSSEGHKTHPVVAMPDTHQHYALLPNITISRKEKDDRDAGGGTKPKDEDIFKHGHQKYFDDTVFSPRFTWPHTVYHTIRLDHVSSIIEALKAGLSNPEIILFTLTYLIRFVNFSKATEVMNLIPDHWCRRNPALLNITATLHFINGDRKKALSLFEHALKLFPDSDWIAQNAIKINLLLNRHDTVNAILRDFRELTGKELEDDYLSHYTAIHGRLPERTATISLCMIIKDEEKTIERAITSARMMADEIIVVDTGSADNSPAIAERLGARVYHYPWCDDFSAARNFAIGKATCDYIFMLDGDEYISPLFFLECQTFTKLLPSDNRCAFRIAIGNYFNETDWLFLVRETGNFRPEATVVRIFPRMGGMRYTGCIGETIEPFLMEHGVPVQIIPDTMLHILHESELRRERIERKCHIFEKMANPEHPLILSAIKEFSLLGQTDATLQWLKHFYDSCKDTDMGKLRMGLHLAKLLEAKEPQQTQQFYLDLMGLYPDSKSVKLAYGEYLITHDQLNQLQNIPFSKSDTGFESTRTEDIEFECLRSLKHFETGDLETAFQTLTDVLEEETFHLFAQSLRFYYLIKMNEIEGAVASLDMLFEIAHCRRYMKIDSIEHLIIAAEELCEALLKDGRMKEKSLICQGILTFGEQWEKK